MKRSIVRLEDSRVDEFGAGLAGMPLLRAFLDSVPVGGKVWEPFAASKHSRLADLCEERGIGYIGHALQPSDKRLWDADSTRFGPNDDVDAVFFNPPYYGAAPFTDDQRELTWEQEGLEDYASKLKPAVRFSHEALNIGGCVFAIGRSYAVQGKMIHLDWIFTQLFEQLGLIVEGCYGSTPDVAILLRKKYV